jgi:hypothetical protein
MIDLLVGAPTEIPGLAHWTGNSYHPLESALVLRGGRLEVQDLFIQVSRLSTVLQKRICL